MLEKKMLNEIHSLNENGRTLKATLRSAVFYIFMNDCTNKLTNETEKKLIFSLQKLNENNFYTLFSYRNLKFRELVEKNVIIS